MVILGSLILIFRECPLARIKDPLDNECPRGQMTLNVDYRMKSAGKRVLFDTLTQAWINLPNSGPSDDLCSNR